MAVISTRTTPFAASPIGRRASALSFCLAIAACGPSDESAPDAGQAERDAGAVTTDASTQDARVQDVDSAADSPVVVSAAIAALALPRDLEAPADATNRYADDPAAALFGRKLFFDASFSGRLMDGDNDGGPQALGNRGDTGKVACASCHVPASYFTDSRSLRQQISLAAGWGLRRAPSLLDVSHSPLLMWDGHRDSLHSQIFGVIESAVEMNSSRLYAAQQVFAHHRAAYEAIFGALPPLDDTRRFPPLSAERTGCSQLDQSRRACGGEWHGVPGDGAEFDSMTAQDQDAVTRVIVNVGKALGSYQRLLSCGESRFDRWARGEDAVALSPSEQRGAALFVGKAQCVSCHSGALFSDEEFHNVGLKPELVATVFLDPEDPGARDGLLALQADPLNSKGAFSDGDDGRIPSTVAPTMLGSFRTPRLRCISKRPSFMHTGHVRTVADVVAFFNRGGDPIGFVGQSELTPLGLSVQERDDLAAFLLSLDGPGPSAELLAP